MANLENNIELSALEDAKQEFQENVSSLITIEGELNKKLAYALSKEKDVVYIDAEELKIITKHLRTILANLLGSYNQMNHTAKHLIFRNRTLSYRGTFVDSVKRALNEQAA